MLATESGQFSRRAAPAATAADITFVQVAGSKDQESKLRRQVVWSHGASGRGEMPVCPDIKRAGWS